MFPPFEASRENVEAEQAVGDSGHPEGLGGSSQALRRGGKNLVGLDPRG